MVSPIQGWHTELEEQAEGRTVELKEGRDWLNKAYKELSEKTEKLERFQRITVGRELEMIKLKEEVNSLLEKFGLLKKYKVPKKMGKI